MSRKITIRLRPEDLSKPYVLEVVFDALTSPQVVGDELDLSLVSYPGEAAVPSPAPDPRAEQIAVAAAERAVRDERAESETEVAPEPDPRAAELEAAREVRRVLTQWAWRGIHITSKVVAFAANLRQLGGPL